MSLSKDQTQGTLRKVWSKVEAQGVIIKFIVKTSEKLMVVLHNSVQTKDPLKDL